ncbi:RagB/SusD family nutrient uptake outer membrane protein [Hymenobacter sp. BRD128]|uniref:RagB/SusD family nutrient uptake outer membrane protein n=1 Tax=Hymenobacter sp. BRD128 TaxID=2675878 RepID=UPI0015642F5F|nr:RagB/SusD family nutrient uptake outer membrane protein [Hymenobacter sp. BRD128]QKG57600.1 RagB/SusD family nutrient uptake outer membrane protein [Hymenobacter sp. BRD128]
MKNIFVKSALALTLGLAGCKDALDIQPQQSIDLSTAFNTSQKVGAAVVGCYAQLDNSSLYGTDLILVPELMASDNYITWRGSFQNYAQLANHIQNAQISNALEIWRQAYANINQTNLVLANLSVVTDSAQRKQFRGEMHFIRAAMYFELVRLYAQQYKAGGANTQPGVPINLTANNTIAQADVKLSRATVQQVYTQVISDLQAAMKGLPALNVTRASSYSAEALLARVYLQQGNYTAARAAADDVITNSGAALAGTLAAVFANRNSAESLFEVQQNDQNNAGTANSGLATFFAGYSPTGDQGILYGRSDVQVNGSFAALYGPPTGPDVRGTDSLTILQTKKLIYLSDGNNRPNQLRTAKWRTYGQNIPLIRLAEMYLIRSECDIRAGNSGLTDLNRVRQRSGATPLTSATLSDVLLERQLELAFEGFRLYDLKRNNLNVREFQPAVPATPTDPGSPAIPAINANDPKEILPIPYQEINNNPNLTQNPSY